MVEFPSSPTTGQVWVAENTATYIWLGNRWNSVIAISNGTAEFYDEGGRAITWATVENGPTDKELDGGVAESYNPILITGHTLSNTMYNADGSVTYSIGVNDNTAAGVILRGVTVDYTQTISGDYGYGSNTVNFTADYQLWNQMVNVIVYITDSRGYTFYSDPILWDVPQGPCLVEGTLITMADGTHKKIEDIGHGDLIKTWNFDLGEFAEAQPIWVKVAEETNGRNVFKFSDGTELQTVGHHVFNKEAGCFTKLIFDETPVGTTTFNERGEEITLVSKETLYDTPTRFYNVRTQYHLNLFANGILTSNRFNNIYPIVDMKFVKDDKALRDISEFEGIDEKYINGLRLQEQEYDIEYIRSYVSNRIQRLDIENTIEQEIL